MNKKQVNKKPTQSNPANQSRGQRDFHRLQEISRHTRTLAGISSLLDWDQETYMPPGGAGIRAEQLKTLAGMIHKEKTEKKFVNALSKLIDIETGNLIAEGLSAPQIAALREWRRDYRIETVLPQKFVEEFTELTSHSIQAWHSAKKNEAFNQFSPFLDQIVAMSRKKAELIGYQDHPYDALLDFYEPNMTTKEISKLFGKLCLFLTDLLKKIASKKTVDDHFLHGNFSPEKQITFGKKILDAMGYDMSKGRLDFSGHPFSSSCHPTDSRITTRIHATSLMSGISTILHEGGHALYEMGLPIEHYGSPLGDAISMGMHESQSRWWEILIGKSRPFWNYYLPLLKQTFSGQLEEVSLDAFYKALNKVSPSMIRVEADEVTYSLHVILRFELECALIEGTLSVRDIPEAWNAKMHELLGITPKNHAEGCLQDIHWSMGGFGYFPTYTLGNLYASHLFSGFTKDVPDWEEKVSHGDLHFIKSWLNHEVHQHGRQYSSTDLLKKITGKTFSEEAFIQHLTQKYAK